MKYTGNINKMVSEYHDPIKYFLPIGDHLLPLNKHIGEIISITFNNRINCIACGREIKKSFNQGYCFPCMRSLAECDMCIMRPEQCHFHKGTCRDESWAQSHCMQDHIVYLSNSSNVKVGITRHTQIPTRWIDQGATQALPIFRVKNRFISGLLEVILKSSVADKTNWRKMLQQKPDAIDLRDFRNRFVITHKLEIEEIVRQMGSDSITPITDQEPSEINFPVAQYPKKITSFNLDKNPKIHCKLMGIKGQYLIFETGVINLRKYAGYFLDFEFIDQ